MQAQNKVLFIPPWARVTGPRGVQVQATSLQHTPNHAVLDALCLCFIEFTQNPSGWQKNCSVAHGVALQLGSSWEAGASRTCLLPLSLGRQMQSPWGWVGGRWVEGLLCREIWAVASGTEQIPVAGNLYFPVGMVTLCVQGLSSSTPSAVPLFVREGLLFN